MTSIRPLRLLAVSLLVAGLLASCSSDDEPGETPVSRPATVRQLVDGTIVPAVGEASSTAAAALASASEFCASPTDAGLIAARQAVAAGWAAWKYTDSFDFGPAMQRRSTSVVSYQADLEKIDATVAASPPADAETVRNRTSSSLRGYGAATHLLWGPPSAPVDAAAFATPAARCPYLLAVLEVVADEASTVDAAWTTGVEGAPPFRDAALGTGNDAMTPTKVIDAAINMQVSQLEATEKLLTAAKEAGPGQPTGLPPAAMFQLAAQVRGMAAVDDSLADLLKPELAARLRTSFASIDSLLADGAAEPTEGEPAPELVAGLATAIADLRATIGTEVVSALDVTITFSDNDGDS